MQIRKRGGRKLIETGVLAFIKEMAPAKKINPSYVGRVLRLTPLAPEIIEAIMEGRQPAGMTTAGLLTGVPVACAEQRALFVDASASDLPPSGPSFIARALSVDGGLSLKTREQEGSRSFNLQPHLIRRPSLRQLRAEAHRTWAAATAVA